MNAVVGVATPLEGGRPEAARSRCAQMRERMQYAVHEREGRKPQHLRHVGPGHKAIPAE